MGGLGEVLGALGGFWGGLREALGAQDRFLIDFGSISKPILGPQTDENRSKIDAKMRSNFASVFESIFDRFWGPFGHHFEAMLGIMWEIGDIAKIIKKPAQGAGF